MKLICGGQSGVDRAALDVAIAGGIAYGGWCPKGGWAEDFPQPPGLLAKYPDLRETPLADPAQRTEWNVRDADACLIVAEAGGIDVSAGTALASDLAHRFRKPLYIAKLGESGFATNTRTAFRKPLYIAKLGDVDVKHARLWLQVQRARHGDDLKLAIGGPRESEAPGIYRQAVEFIRLLIVG